MTTSETTWSVIFMSDPSVDRTVASALPTNEADLDARPCSQVGNVYAKFFDEEHADAALKGLDGRFYAGQKLLVEFSPVTDFREARCAGSGSVGILIRSWLELTDMRLALSRTPIYRCRQYDEGGCKYGPYCNFMHVKKIGRTLAKDLEKRFGKVTNVEFVLGSDGVGNRELMYLRLRRGCAFNPHRARTGLARGRGSVVGAGDAAKRSTQTFVPLTGSDVGFRFLHAIRSRSRDRRRDRSRSRDKGKEKKGDSRDRYVLIHDA